MGDREYADPETGEVLTVKHIPPARPQPVSVSDVPSLALNSPSTAELTKALIIAQAEFKTIARESTAMATQTRSYKYAPLEVIIAATREGLIKAGLVITQTTVPSARGALLVTMLQHISGEWKASYWPLSTNGRSQEQGSELTYARRYQRCAILDIQPEDADDDGAATQERPVVKPAQRKPEPRPPRPVTQEVKEFVDGIEPAPYAKGSEPAPDGLPVFIGVPTSVGPTSTGKGHRVYFAAKDGLNVGLSRDEWFATFSESAVKLAKDAVESKVALQIVYETNKFGKRIVELRPVA